MTSRAEILGRLREQTLPEVPLPRLDFERQSFDDPLGRFEEVLGTTGGTSRRFTDQATAVDSLKELDCYRHAEKIASTVPEVPGTNVDLAGTADLHDLHDVDVAILTGSFAVAENAAIWLDLATVKHRVICVLSQHLVLLVPAREIVATMHEAYARIASDDQRSPNQVGFGMFLSGPSKTADIEQSLVIGAHGARSVTVLLWGDEG